MRPSRRLVAAVAVAVALAAASTATAQFTRSAAAGPASLASATLAPPTATTAAQTNCKANKPVTITVSWTATTSVFATGYRIERATSTAGPFSLVASIAIGTTSQVDSSPGLAYTTPYVYRVLATFQSWTAPSAAASMTTLSSVCK
jgi:hypothetical protein